MNLLVDELDLEALENWPREKTEALYQDAAQLMYELTKAKCLTIDCKGGCCFPEVCDSTKLRLEHLNVPFQVQPGQKMCFMSESGCILEPWKRPICTVHICEKLLYADAVFSDQYFHLRENINVLLYCLERDDMALDVEETCGSENPVG